ncbi:MAG: four helix bundle protein [Gemmatimonadales bacterium]
MRLYARLDAWKASHRLTVVVYQITSRWPREERYGLVAQARRAAFSVSANIAEGSARRGAREFARFLAIAVASLAELAYVSELARDLGILAGKDLEEFERCREDAGKLTWRLYQSIRRAATRK